MNIIKRLSILLALIVSVSSVSFAEEAVKETTTSITTTTTTTTETAAPAGMTEEMMAKMKEYATPNENHKVLEALVGSWTYTSKWWMDPAGEPEVSSGTAENAWVLGGRFIHEHVQGMSMGQPFEGVQITGYDNAKKEYVSTWMDNMGTGMMISKSGTYDAATKTLTQEADFLCPMKGQMVMRWVTKFIDENTYSFEIYGTENGKEMKAMEMIYKRK